MTLEELKILVGMPTGDPTEDLELTLYLEGALEAAEAYTDKLQWPLVDYPASVALGIKLWIETMRQMSENKGIASESMAGMSQTFAKTSNDQELFADVYKLWGRYHTDNTHRAVFMPSKRRFGV